MIRSFILSLSILLILSLSGCGGGDESDIPEWCQDPETFVGPQSEECYQ